MVQPVHALSRNTVLILIGATLVLHNSEEYLTFPAFFRSPGRLRQWLPAPSLLENTYDLHLALAMATFLPLALIAWAVLRPGKPLLVSALFLESVLLVNAGWHILAAGINRAYVPGLITAALINLPFGIYVLRKAVTERWIGSKAAWRMIAIAAALHIAAAGSLLG